MVQNESRKSKSHAPEGSRFGDIIGEAGAAWNMTGEPSGKVFRAATIEHANIRARKAFDYLGQWKA